MYSKSLLSVPSYLLTGHIVCSRKRKGHTALINSNDYYLLPTPYCKLYFIYYIAFVNEYVQYICSYVCMYVTVSVMHASIWEHVEKSKISWLYIFSPHVYFGLIFHSAFSFHEIPSLTYAFLSVPVTTQLVFTGCLSHSTSLVFIGLTRFLKMYL